MLQIIIHVLEFLLVRFTCTCTLIKGEAGNRLLDHCVPYDSCGTNFPLWSDDRMPTSVGVPMTFKVYSSVADDCRHEAFAASVIRCSNKPADFVYRWEVNTKDKFDCFYGFCGMTA